MNCDEKTKMYRNNRIKKNTNEGMLVTCAGIFPKKTITMMIIIIIFLILLLSADTKKIQRFLRFKPFYTFRIDSDLKGRDDFKCIMLYSDDPMSKSQYLYRGLSVIYA